MKADIVMIGHISQDIIVDYLGNRQELIGGAVVYSSFSAAASGAKVTVVTKLAKEDDHLISDIQNPSITWKVIDSKNSTAIRNTYFTADKERREVVLLSQAEPFVINDDVASSPVTEMENRRGVAGEIILWKILGYLADSGADLKTMKKVGDQVVFNTRSLGVAHTPCIMPSSGKPSFEIGDDEMEIGVGHHGEPGIERVKMMSANEITDIIMEKVLVDLPFKEGDEVSVIVNGLGSTSLLELYIIYSRVEKTLKDNGIKVFKSWVGDFFTSMEMGGFSVTLTKLDETMKKGVLHPINAVHFPS
jgi:dihydroxyacetone kinase